MPLPWTDRAGNLSALKLAVFLGCLAPAVLLAGKALTIGLGSKPTTYAIHDTGDWAVRFLLLSLLITPLRSIAQWPALIQVRRMLGVTALAYVLVHLAIYVVELRYDWIKVASEIVSRVYLSIGFAALLGLAVLGATSTDGMIKRLGSARWNRLHAMVYGLTVLALVHFFLQSRIDVTQPVLMAGFFLWLMGWRIVKARRWPVNAGALVLLSLAAGLLTALLEAGWYAGMTGVPGARVLAANLDFSFTIRPAWWVLGAGLGLAAVQFWRADHRTARPGRGDAPLAPLTQPR